MRKELEAIKTAWENRPAAGRASSAEDGAELAEYDKEIVELADAFVKANPVLFSEYEDFTIHQCVKTLETFRDAGLEQSAWLVQTWIFHRFEFQTIGGEAQAQIRVVNGE